MFTFIQKQTGIGLKVLGIGLGLALFSGLTNEAYAQRPKQDTTSVTVTGTVFLLPDSTTGAGNVEILFKGKAKGTTTAADGTFKLVGYLATDTTLLVAYPGFIPTEVRLEDITEGLKIKLSPEPLYTNIGVGSVEQRLSPFSIATVGAGALRQHSANNFEGGLQGRVAGLQVTQSNGLTSATVLARLRGMVNVEGDGAPLVVLDGVPLVTGTNGDGGGNIGNNYGYTISALAELNTWDIEKIEVLKDGASQALYGARGANGVYLITTKRGVTGKTRFNLNYNVGITQPTNTVKLANGSQYRNAVEGAWQNTFGSALPTDSAHYYTGGNKIFGLTPDMVANTNTNWLDKNLQTGAVQHANLNISGGSKRVNFFASVDYRQENGILKGTNQDRLSVRFNAENKATSFLTIGLRTQLGLSFGNYMPSGLDTSGGFGMAQSAALPIFAETLGAGLTDPYNSSNRFFNPYAGTNATLLTDRTYFRNQRNVFRNVGVIYASFDFLKHFNFRSEAGIDYLNNNDRTFRSGMIRLKNALLPSGNFQLVPTAAATDGRQLLFNTQLNNYLTYKRNYGSSEVVATLGNQFTYNSASFNRAASERMPNEYSGLTSAGAIGLGLPTGGNTGFAYNAWFGRLQMAFSDKYVVTASARAESSSRFGDNNLWAVYPAVAGAWVMSKEDFMANVSWVSQLKLRASTALTGNSMFNNDIAVGYWRGGPSYVDPSTFIPGRSQLQLANPQLTSDNILHTTVGVDGSLFDNRITLSADWFLRQNTNGLVALPVAPSQGVTSGRSFENKAKLTATGVELTISSQNIRSADFNWTTDLTLAYTASTVNDLAGININQSPTYGDIRLAAGNPYGAFYLAKWAGVATEDDAAGRWKKGDELIYDRDGNKFRPTRIGQIDSARVLVSGRQNTPTVYGGLNNTITFKGFDLGVFFTYALGQSVLDYGSWRQAYVTGQNNLRETALTEANLYYGNDPLASVITDRFLQNASYIRLRNLQVGYTLPSEWCKSRGFVGGRIYFNAENVWTFAPQFKGWDPEVAGNLGTGLAGNLGQGITAFDLPQVRTYMLGLSITF